MELGTGFLGKSPISRIGLSAVKSKNSHFEKYPHEWQKGFGITSNVVYDEIGLLCLNIWPVLLWLGTA